MCIQDNSFGNVIGSISSVFTGFINLYEDKAVAEYKNNQIKEQAEQAREKAGQERQEGIEEARNRRLQAILNMGDKKVLTAGGNIALSSQTTINQLDNIKLNGELDALTTLKSAENRAQSYEQQAHTLYSNYALGKFNAKRNFRNGMIKQVENTAKTAVQIAALV